MKARVLIIEDVKEMADLIRMYLQKEGMDASICETGEDALAQFPEGVIAVAGGQVAFDVRSNRRGLVVGCPDKHAAQPLRLLIAQFVAEIDFAVQ